MKQPQNYGQNQGRVGAEEEAPSFSLYHQYPVTLAAIVAAGVMFLLLILSFCKCFRTSFQHPPSPYDHREDQDQDKDREHREEKLSAIPVITYVAAITLPSSSTASFERMNCSICLAEFVDSDEVRVLPRCKHIFHKKCIDPWLRLRSLYCPNCRDQTIEKRLELKDMNICHGNNTSDSNL